VALEDRTRISEIREFALLTKPLAQWVQLANTEHRNRIRKPLFVEWRKASNLRLGIA